MFYAKLTPQGEVERYPYTLTDLRRDCPGTSFPPTITDETAREFGAVPVQPAPQPAHDWMHNVSRAAARQGDAWIEVWSIVPASAEEIAARLASQWAAVREQRNAKLSASDWTQLPDSPMSAALRSDWAAYRQALRDVPAQGDPFALQWPAEPLEPASENTP